MKYKINTLFSILPFLTYENKVDGCVGIVHSSQLKSTLKVLRDFSLTQYKILSSISVVDYPSRKLRFEVVYELLSVRFNHRFRLKTYGNEKIHLESVENLYSCANWWEREAYDIFGVFFAGHSDLRRLLSDYGFDGHPLRKDFPLSGYLDLRYDDLSKKVVYDNLTLDQAYRQFTYKTYANN
jgi:NADH/F420H2 dehydrogenase subunit C